MTGYDISINSKTDQLSNTSIAHPTPTYYVKQGHKVRDFRFPDHSLQYWFLHKQ